MHLSNNNLLNKNHLDHRKSNNFTGHSQVSHPLYKEEFQNGSLAIVNFLNTSVLAQARNLRMKTLYGISADKCFSNNNYSFSESQECEKLLLEKDPVLNNIKNYVSHVETSFIDQNEKNLNNVTCAKEYYKQHKLQLMRMNHLYRYYYYFIAKDLFINSLD